MILSIISSVTLLVINSFSYIKDANDVVYAEATDYIDARFREFLSVIDRYIGATLPTVFFWMFVGMIVYVIGWVGFSAYVAYRDDIPRTKGMILPRGANKSKLFRESIAHFLVRTISFVLLAYWIFMLVTEIIPLTSDMFLGEEGQGIAMRIFTAIGSVVILALSLFVCFVLARCVVMRDRIFIH